MRTCGLVVHFVAIFNFFEIVKCDFVEELVLLFHKLFALLHHLVDLLRVRRIVVDIKILVLVDLVVL